MTAQDPYTPKKSIGNAICLLMQSGIFPLKEFDTWEAMPIESYPILKTFIHEAYSRCLTSIQSQNTEDQQGYGRGQFLIKTLQRSYWELFEWIRLLKISPGNAAKYVHYFE
jgi:hypothetical protein